MGGMEPEPAGAVAFYSVSVMIKWEDECRKAYAEEVSRRRRAVAEWHAVSLGRTRTRTRDGDLGEAGDGRSLGDGGS